MEIPLKFRTISQLSLVLDHLCLERIILWGTRIRIDWNKTRVECEQHGAL